MKNRLYIAGLAILFTACEQIIELDYKENESLVTIEANITTDPGPYFVKITKSIALQDSGPYPTVDNAEVTLTDDAGHSETLVPMGNGVYATQTITGVEGTTYTLTVNAENQLFTAQSTIPKRVPFDGIHVDEVSVTGEIEYNLIPKYLDPIEIGNKYQFIMTVNDTLVSQHLVQNDDIENGLENSRYLQYNDEDLKLKPGDKVSLRMQCIDAGVSSYFTALALMGDSGPGGGTTPNNPPTNFSNGALGVFSAHTQETRVVIIE